MSFAKDVDRFMARREAAARERVTDRDRFLRDLAADLIYQLGSGVEATADELREALGLALDGATVRRDTEMRRNPADEGWSTLDQRDDGRHPGPRPDDVEGYRYTITTRPREFDADEQARRDESRARREERAVRARTEYLWAESDHQTPPPDDMDLYRIVDRQATWWRPRVDGELVWCRITDLTPARHIGVLGFLLHSLADDYKDKSEWSFFAAATGPMGPRGEHAQDMVEAEMAELHETSAQALMRRQPLVRALVKLAKLDRLRGLRLPGCSLDEDIYWTWEGFRAYREERMEEMRAEFNPDHD